RIDTPQGGGGGSTPDPSTLPMMMAGSGGSCERPVLDAGSQLGFGGPHGFATLGRSSPYGATQVSSRCGGTIGDVFGQIVFDGFLDPPFGPERTRGTDNHAHDHPEQPFEHHDPLLRRRAARDAPEVTATVLMTGAESARYASLDVASTVSEIASALP